MSFEAVDFIITDSTPQHSPVAGVTVKVVSADGTLFYSQAVSDSTGTASFLLPSGVALQARYYKFQVGFTNPQLFTVYPSPLSAGQTNTFDVCAHLLTPPVPQDARLCTAFGYFRDITGAPQSDVEIHFIAKFDPTWVDGSAVVSERIIVRTNKRGYVEVNLFRHAHYDCTIQGEEDITRHLKVPDAPNVNLPDLIFPIVQSLVITPVGPYTISVGQELTLAFEVIASDGENLHSGYGDIMLSTSDDTVLNYAYTRAGLVLIGIAPGTAQINVCRANRSIVHIPDAGISGQPLLVTVVP